MINTTVSMGIATKIVQIKLNAHLTRCAQMEIVSWLAKPMWSAQGTRDVMPVDIVLQMLQI